ncbi:hypothetical protein NQZ68_034857 [Dissostichus eleginoides]|nr:hypothetical protein NQZ68_034857 [Dissostichus eleginoides]
MAGAIEPSRVHSDLTECFMANRSPHKALWTLNLHCSLGRIQLVAGLHKVGEKKPTPPPLPPDSDTCNQALLELPGDCKLLLV